MYSLNLKLLMFLFILLVPYPKGFASSSTFSISGNWQKSELVKLKIKHSQENTIQGQNMKMISTKNVEIKILDKDTSGYRIEWWYKTAKLEGIENPAQKAMTDFAVGVKVIFLTDTNGKFKYLDNIYAIQRHLKKGLEKFEKKAGDEKMEYIAKQLKLLIETRDAINEAFSKEIILYYNYYGEIFKKDSTIILETKLPNPLGGESFPGTLFVKVDSVNFENNYCKIGSRLELDKEKTNAIFLNMYRQVYKQAGKPEPSAKDIPKVNVKDVSTSIFDLKSGWNKKTYIKREINSKDLKQIESFDFSISVK
ncbi:MAG: hypothetical protein NT007_10020 [Candidatus Kapabacteria bacterium]|nr:hypothetical protein [Candidatus Kapabacteria bacterium]